MSRLWDLLESKNVSINMCNNFLLASHNLICKLKLCKLCCTFWDIYYIYIGSRSSPGDKTKLCLINFLLHNSGILVLRRCEMAKIPNSLRLLVHQWKQKMYRTRVQSSTVSTNISRRADTKVLWLNRSFDKNSGFINFLIEAKIVLNNLFCLLVIISLTTTMF